MCPKCKAAFIHPLSKDKVVDQQHSGSPMDSPIDAAQDTPANKLVVQPIEFFPTHRHGVSCNGARYYGCGIGSEYVYIYTYPSLVEIGSLKQDKNYRIKVGSATGDPIERVYQQFSSSKTAIPEQPRILLIIRTLSARHLERWLHRRLQKADGATGSEWFYSNPDEVLSLFRQYVAEAVVRGRVEPDVDQVGSKSDGSPPSQHGSSETTTTYSLEYWNTFYKDYLSHDRLFRNCRVDSPRRLRLTSDTGVHLETVRNIKASPSDRVIGVWLILKGVNRSELFRELLLDKQSIEHRIRRVVETDVWDWDSPRSGKTNISRHTIRLERKADAENRKEWTPQHKWLYETANQFMVEFASRLPIIRPISDN